MDTTKRRLLQVGGLAGDTTRRDLQRGMGDQKKPWEIGKSFDQSAPLDKRRLRWAAIAIALAFSGATCAAATPRITTHEIAGQVIGDHGPEAGVWVIAETRDLPTRYAKVVVTDDEGRFVVPQLPKARYQVWARGYGLVDSARTATATGRRIVLKAVTAPDEKAAAYYYPGMYWYALLDIPQKEDFVAGSPGNQGMAPTMKLQSAWVDTVKNMCQSCHALGSQGIREMPALFRKHATRGSAGRCARRPARRSRTWRSCSAAWDRRRR